ncbi:phage tail domain-containing protein [Virgibacillus sp. CBA3643]|uniref:phage tail domain-containing protein n=1 Tax=Virgibacillus sp. CBA3643 TaxID=2942278 RepID=UPI0035A32F52
MKIATYYDENMNELDTENLFTTHLDVPSTNFTNNWLAGEDGIPPIFAGSTVQQKTVTATIEIIAYDYLDYSLLKSYLHGVFGFGKPFYVVDNREPGKRTLVVLESNFRPERHNPVNGTATIPFTTVNPHYTESIGTTQDIQENGISANDELWGFGMGLIADDDSLNYTHTGASFRIYNAGNVAVHPFEQELSITIDNVQGSTDYLELRNTTNGSTFRVNEGVSSSQTILLDGPNVTSNGLQFLRNTNKQYIELVPGWNDFTVSGATSARVSMDFPFYYL